jgi:hypothetical protein
LVVLVLLVFEPLGDIFQYLIFQELEKIVGVLLFFVEEVGNLDFGVKIELPSLWIAFVIFQDKINYLLLSFSHFLFVLIILIILIVFLAAPQIPIFIFSSPVST